MDRSCPSLVSTLARKVMQKEALREALSEIPSGIVEVVKSDELQAAVKLRPLEHCQTEWNCGRVKGIDIAIQLET